MSHKPTPHPLAHRMPANNQFNVRLLGEEKSPVLESLYAEGFIGCFDAPENTQSVKSIADYDKREFFLDTPGKHRWSEIHDSLDSLEGDGCHVHTKDAFDAWERDGIGGPDWLFGIFQDSGCCVDASNVEMKAGLLGYRAMRPQYAEIMKYLPAFWTYAWRGHCGGGWTMGACATKNKLHGWAPAKQYGSGRNSIDFDDENESERLVTSAWCRSGPPSWMYDEVTSTHVWNDSAITYFDGGLDGLKRLFENGGQFHHGGNSTSSSGRPNTWRRIGGHAQTAFGGDWSDATIGFFADKGFRLNASGDFWVANHQTWGGSWSGSTSENYWPPQWGPKPQGAWVCAASDLLKRVDGYAYLPDLVGVKGDGPQPQPNDHPAIVNTLRTDTGDVIRGDLLLTCGDEDYAYIVSRRGTANSYDIVPRPTI